jgi:hypothetical protein
MRALSVALLAAVLLAACGTGPEAGSQPGELEVIVPPDDNGEYPPELIVSCPGGPSFPISALDDNPLLSEADPDGVAEAIAPFLESGEGKFWPQEDWRVLHQTDNEVLLVHYDDPTLSFMNVEREGDEWVWSGSQSGGPCPLQFTTPEGLNTVEWRLDPSVPALGAEDDSVAVILNERECVSGQAIGDRLVGPQIVMTETQVFIAFATERPPGEAFDCQGNPDTPFVVDLPESLGDRELVEGLSTGLDLEDYLG